jgi:hypothetical protein
MTMSRSVEFVLALDLFLAAVDTRAGVDVDVMFSKCGIVSALLTLVVVCCVEVVGK